MKIRGKAVGHCIERAGEECIENSHRRTTRCVRFGGKKRKGLFTLLQELP